MAGYFVRLTMCVALTALAKAFPPGAPLLRLALRSHRRACLPAPPLPARDRVAGDAPDLPAGASSFVEHSAWFGALSAIGLVTSFSSTLMFTALGSFFNRISDPGAQTRWTGRGWSWCCVAHACIASVFLERRCSTRFCAPHHAHARMLPAARC